MKGKKRYGKRKGIRKRREISNIMWVTQEIRKQLNRLRDAVEKKKRGEIRVSSFRVHTFNIINNNNIIPSFNNDLIKLPSFNM